MTHDYRYATRTIFASFTAVLAGAPDPDGITAAITDDVRAATGRTPDELGVTVTVTSNVTATLTLPGAVPASVPVSEVPGRIVTGARS